jgi:hypothetical protein
MNIAPTVGSEVVDKALIGLPTNEGERKIALRNRWYTILLLLRLLLSALHGHPELKDSGRTDTEKMVLKNQRSLFKMCEAIAHILPKYHEITAVTGRLTLENSKFARSPFTTAILRLTVVVTGAREPGTGGVDLEDQGTQEEGVQTASRTNQYSQTFRNITRKPRFTLFCVKNPVQAELKNQAAKTKPNTSTKTKPNTPTHSESFSIKSSGVSYMSIINVEGGPWKALEFE